MDTYLQKLISFKSTSNDQEVSSQAIDYLIAFCKSHNLHITEYEFDGFRAFTATTAKDTMNPKVCLGAHIDVVPGEPELFTLREQDGKYFGRGVYDMKFAIAAYMHIIDSLGDDLKNYDLGLMITSDEELGGQSGVKKLVAQGFKPGVCILPDGGQDWNIETLAKGMMFGKLEVKGKTAHGSRPWEGDSAIVRIAAAIQEINDSFREQKKDTNSVNFGVISGGEAINQIPAYASVTLDIRYMQPQDYATIIKTITEIAERHGAAYTKSFADPPCITDLQHPMVAPFVQSITAITGHKVGGTMSIGGSDARFFATVDVPCILTHPEGGKQHAEGEWISKHGYEQFIEVLLDYVNKIAKN